MTEKPKNEFGYRTDRGWRIDDLYTFEVISHSDNDLAKIKDDYAGAFKPTDPAAMHSSGLGTTSQNAGKPGLIVKIAATHAGLVTRNNGFYMPDKMRAAVSTWTDHYPKPIQIHHNDQTDPVGRVIAARYVDTSGPVIDRFQNSVLRDSYKNQVGYADKKFWDKFISDKTSFIDKLQMLKVMDSVLSDPHYQGVGYIELTANITDPDAISKVLDGRYITGSVGAVSDKAVCSVCNTDWLEEEHCGHRPGRVYDGKKCMVVTGNLEYDEYSFVNTPADRHSGVLGLEQIKNSVHDSVDKTIQYFPVFELSREGSVMSAQINDSVENSTPVSNETVTDQESDSTVAQVQDSTEAPVAEDIVTVLLDKLLKDGSLTEEENDKLYELQLVDMDPSVLEDAKLSTEKRKKLASSTFCGPGRSFPVPDCAHVTAARRLIGRYKGEGSKDAILACVARKAKALGCDSSQDSVTTENKVQDSVQEVVQEVVQTPEWNYDFHMKGNNELTDAFKLDLAKEFIARFTASDLKDSLVPALLSAGLVVDPEEIKALEVEVAKGEELIGDLRDQLAVLRKELKAAYDDVITVEDQLIAARETARAVKSDKVSLLHMLDGSLTDSVKDNLLTLTDEALDSTIATLSAKVDIHKIVDKLNNGLSRTPDETVEPPVGLTEPATVTQPSNKPTFATQQMVDEVYRRTLLSQGHQVAQAFYQDAVKRGLANPKE